MDRKLVDIEFMMSRWSTETHTSVTAWGKFSPTLEDVTTLASSLILGEAYVVNVTISEGLGGGGGRGE